MRMVLMPALISAALVMLLEAARGRYGMIGLTAGETLRINAANPTQRSFVVLNQSRA